MLNERLAGLDFYPTPVSAGPFVAVPYVAIHGTVTSGVKKLCDGSMRDL
jgi:hypothetical protein